MNQMFKEAIWLFEKKFNFYATSSKDSDELKEIEKSGDYDMNINTDPADSIKLIDLLSKFISLYNNMRKDFLSLPEFKYSKSIKYGSYHKTFCDEGIFSPRVASSNVCLKLILEDVYDNKIPPTISKGSVSGYTLTCDVMGVNTPSNGYFNCGLGLGTTFPDMNIDDNIKSYLAFAMRNEEFFLLYEMLKNSYSLVDQPVYLKFKFDGDPFSGINSIMISSDTKFSYGIVSFIIKSNLIDTPSFELYVPDEEGKSIMLKDNDLEEGVTELTSRLYLLKSKLAYKMPQYMGISAPSSMGMGQNFFNQK